MENVGMFLKFLNLMILLCSEVLVKIEKKIFSFIN